ncbi:MAG: DUF3313 family protein [Pseudomonadota bacterium]
MPFGRFLPASAVAAALLVVSVFAGPPAAALSSVSVSGFDDAAEAVSDFSDYTSFYVQSVTAEVEANESRQFRPSEGFSTAISQDEIEQQADRLEAQLERWLSRRIEAADGPGEGVLVIDAVLTELIPTRPTLEGLSQEPTLSLSGSVGVGGAAVRIEISDGASEEVIAQYSDTRTNGNLNDGLPRIGVWSDAERAYSSWARSLARHISKTIGEAE